MADNLNQLILEGVTAIGSRNIGLGAYARVYEVNYEGTLCAAKEMHAVKLEYAQGDELQKIIDDFQKECQIWSTLRHPCIVQFLGLFTDNEYKLFTIKTRPFTLCTCACIMVMISHRYLPSSDRPACPACYCNGEDAAKPEKSS